MTDAITVARLDPAHHAEFRYPQSWLADQSIFRRQLEAAERRRSLDPLSPRCSPGPAFRPVL